MLHVPFGVLWGGVLVLPIWATDFRERVQAEKWDFGDFQSGSDGRLKWVGLFGWTVGNRKCSIGKPSMELSYRRHRYAYVVWV